MGNKNWYLFGVCDGHGINGHHVSGYVKANLPSFPYFLLFIFKKILSNKLILFQITDKFQLLRIQH